MNYPNFKNKHLEQALFNPQDYNSWKGYLEKDYGKAIRKYIIIYYPNILKYFKKNHKTQAIGIYRLIKIYKYKNVGVVCMTGIGAPNAVTVMEELIALGGREFINMGSCGGLCGFGTFLCDKAIRDEGTSQHYVPHEKFSYPDKALTERLGKYMRKHDIKFQQGTNWTIDAPYRETKAEIKHYKKEGVKTVEMEASALFVVAKVRKVKIASAFVVSDLLEEEKWDPQFDAKHVNKNLHKLFDASLDCLLKK
jgi:uridine phosphorylase